MKTLSKRDLQKQRSKYNYKHFTEKEKKASFHKAIQGRINKIIYKGLLRMKEEQRGIIKRP